MAAKDKIMELLATDSNALEELRSSLRAGKARLSGFNASLNAIEGDEAALQLKARLVDKIQREYASMQRYEQQIADCEGRLAAFEETLKILQKSEGDSDLRAGSQMDKVRELIRKHGKPMALTDILKALDLEGDEKKRNSLRGSLAGYAREGRVFTKESAPDTFGLLELKSAQAQEVNPPI